MDHKIIILAVILLFFFMLMLRSIKLALLVYLFLCPFNIFIPVGSKNINSTEAVALLFIVVWLFGLLRKDRPCIPDTVFTAPLFFYFLSSLILIVNTGLTGDVILSLIRHLQFFCVFLIFVTYFKDRKDIFSISNALIASLAVLCLIAIIEIIFVYGGFGNPAPRSILWKKGLMNIGLYPGTELAIKRMTSASGKAGIASVFAFPNSFGIYLGFMTYLLVWRIYLYKKLNIKRMGMILLLIVSFCILILTKGRTAIFSFLLSIPIIVVLLRNWSLRFKIIFVVAVSIILIFAFVPDTIIKSSVNWIENLNTRGLAGLSEGDSNRVTYFFGSLITFLKNPFIGAGYRILDMDISPHMAFTQALVLKGILGGIALFWVLLRMFRVSNRHLRRVWHKKADKEYFLSLGWLLSISIYLSVQSIGVGLFGHILACIPAISAMSMFVISRRSFAVDKSHNTVVP
ncbi:O-antigen ligase family protein [Acidobacteriota bacterium]